MPRLQGIVTQILYTVIDSETHSAEIRFELLAVYLSVRSFMRVHERDGERI